MMIACRRLATAGLVRAALVCLLAAAVLPFCGGCGRKMVRGDEPARARPHRDRYTLTHVVGEGETLARIAENYYLDESRVADIAAWNGIDDPDRLAADSVLELRFDAGEWDRAEQRLAALDPYNQGVDALRSGRLDEAREAFAQALDLDPEFSDASYNLALVYLKRGRNTDAVALLDDLLAADPDDTDYLFAYGNAQFHQAEFAAAAGTFAAILDLRPGHRQAAFGRARALTEAGRRPEAIAAWQTYLALDASSAWSDRAREQLRILREGGDAVP